MKSLLIKFDLKRGGKIIVSFITVSTGLPEQTKRKMEEIQHQVFNALFEFTRKNRYIKPNSNKQGELAFYSIYFYEVFAFLMNQANVDENEIERVASLLSNNVKLDALGVTGLAFCNLSNVRDLITKSNADELSKMVYREICGMFKVFDKQFQFPRFAGNIHNLLCPMLENVRCENKGIVILGSIRSVGKLLRDNGIQHTNASGMITLNKEAITSLTHLPYRDVANLLNTVFMIKVATRQRCLLPETAQLSREAKSETITIKFDNSSLMASKPKSIVEAMNLKPGVVSMRGLNTLIISQKSLTQLEHLPYDLIAPCLNSVKIAISQHGFFAGVMETLIENSHDFAGGIEKVVLDPRGNTSIQAVDEESRLVPAHDDFEYSRRCCC